MKLIQKIKGFISSHFIFLLKILIYSYLTVILIGFIPLYGLFFEGDWYDWTKITAFYGDIYQYEAMAYGNFDEVIAPYKFRILIPFLWSIFLPIMPLRYSVIFWNFIFLFGSSLLTDKYLKHFGFSEFYRFLGVILLNISFPIIQTAFTPNIDIALLFFSFLFMIGIVEKNPWLIGISSIFGVLTKESFLFLFPIYFIYNFKEIKNSFFKLLRDRKIPDIKIIISILFIIFSFFIFLIIRGFVFNIYYDYNIGEGEFPNFYKRWLDLASAFTTLKYIFFTLTILWFAPLGYFIHKWKFDEWLIVSLYGYFTIFMVTLLSYRISRVGFFLIVIYLPLFLRLIKDFDLEEFLNYKIIKDNPNMNNSNFSLKVVFKEFINFI